MKPRLALKTIDEVVTCLVASEQHWIAAIVIQMREELARHRKGTKKQPKPTP